jgi:hypothetical protein
MRQLPRCLRQVGRARTDGLPHIERGFRALMSEIGPVHHRLPRRIGAHALVCILVLILHRVLRMRLKASNRRELAAKLLAQLRRIQHQTAQSGDGDCFAGCQSWALSRGNCSPRSDCRCH